MKKSYKNQNRDNKAIVIRIQRTAGEPPRAVAHGGLSESLFISQGYGFLHEHAEYGSASTCILQFQALVFDRDRLFRELEGVFLIDMVIKHYPI